VTVLPLEHAVQKGRHGAVAARLAGACRVGLRASASCAVRRVYSRGAQARRGLRQSDGMLTVK
jgi:hypothetical protein